MPNVRIQHPAGIFSSTKHKEIYMEAVAVYIARSLSCNDNAVVHSDVDVTLVPYSAEDARMPGTMFVVEIMGIDYRDRMHTIKPRLDDLKAALKSYNLSAFDGEDGDISLMFIPVAKECWV